MLSTFYTFNSSMGVIFTMKALIIVIMGGVGDVRGAVLAALLLGLAETAVASLIDPGLTLAATYALFILVLLFRPAGHFRKAHDMTAMAAARTARLRRSALLVGSALAAAIPLADDGYYLSLSVNIAIYVVLCTAWTLFSGPTHYISLATAAFFGIGTYTVGARHRRLAVSRCLSPSAAVVAGVLAALVGLATCGFRASIS